MFEPGLALASLSGESDAEWALDAEEWAGAAFLGGIALDAPTRTAARELVARDRTEFLPDDPVSFVDRELSKLDDSDLRAGFNVRAVTAGPLREAARACAAHDAILEVNAHCRQDEMCHVGAGETLLWNDDDLCALVRVAAAAGPDVSVKVRTEVPGVDLPDLAARLETAGADCLHVDAMDSEHVVGEIRERFDGFLIANNGVRDRETVHEYLAYGADAVSVGRPSDDPRVLARVRRALDAEAVV
jgi:TIM-barrel protein